VIDLHSHILPGIDDGARSLEEARELARLAVREGVTAIAATPHVRADYPTTPERMERGVSELQRDFGDQGIRLEVVRGGEVDIERLSALSEADLERFTLAGGGRYLLLEFPYFGWPLALDAAVATLVGLGLTPVLAHPERNATVQERPSRLGGLVAAGALVQVTAGSLAGAFGRSSRNAARALVASGLVHVLASDAHSPDARDAGLAAGVEALEDAGLAAYLTEETPAAIVAGEEVGRTPRRRRFRLPPRWEAGLARATTIIRRGSE
jgi:protein-tyrosine phosphatase